MVKTRQNKKKNKTSKYSSRSIDNSVKNLELQATDTIIIESQSADYTNVKKRRGDGASLISSDNNAQMKILSTNVASSSLIRKSSFKEDYDYNQQLSSLIGPFKNDLDVCLYLVQHPQLVELALNMIKAGGDQKSITQEKAADKFNALSERRELRKLVPEFIRKYKLTKTNQLITQQITKYITEDN
ncbi:hypothetical protein F8M41_026232 [Gigaspora margarita]|uniref:Uncharacterized protein n=1 Tax=Gigaspora margarita TaxID=4874 RepID=A0A8H3XIR9_GIGMA|nr:hypothetical protein F8M41_026232 [Gigaspora margarita]